MYGLCELGGGRLPIGFGRKRARRSATRAKIERRRVRERAATEEAQKAFWPPAETILDPFRATNWNQLQAVLWVCSRSRVVVRLAADRMSPGAADEDTPDFDDDYELIWATIQPGGYIWKRMRWDRLHCTFDESIERILGALQSGRLHAFARRNGSNERVQVPQQEWADLRFHWDRPEPEFGERLPMPVRNSRRYVAPPARSHIDAPCWTDVLLNREQLLALWPDPIRSLLAAMPERLTLAEAVGLLVRERPARKEGWARLRRRSRGAFPASTKLRIGDAGEELVAMLRRSEVAGQGRLCRRDQGTGRMVPTDGARTKLEESFLDEALWVDPCVDGLWTEPLVGGQFSPVDFGYRDVLLSWRRASDAAEKIEYPNAHTLRDSVGATALPVDAPGSGEHSTPRVKRPGPKPRTTGFAASDAPLVEEMHRIIAGGSARSAWDAALALAGRAAGRGKDESRAKRLLRRYVDRFGDDETG